MAAPGSGCRPGCHSIASSAEQAFNALRSPPDASRQPCSRKSSSLALLTYLTTERYDLSQARVRRGGLPRRPLVKAIGA
jgi:hypothetical protein